MAATTATGLRPFIPYKPEFACLCSFRAPTREICCGVPMHPVGHRSPVIA